MTPVYELEDVRIRRTGGETSFELIVERLTIPRGALLALVGPSGCGKSTLLDLLCLVSVPTHAKRFLFAPADGQPVDVGALLKDGQGDRLAALRRDGIGYVLQTGGLLAFLSVRRNIGLSLALRGEAPEPAVSTLARALGVETHLAKYPSALSVGERQRVAIGRALAHRPAVVLADEPTAALDPANALRVMAQFAGFAREAGATLVVATHDRTRVEAAGFTCLVPTLSTDGSAVEARLAG